MDKLKILHLETRRKIFNYIKDNPGLHLHDLAKKLDIKYFNLRYHLNILEKSNMVLIKNNNSYSRVYPKENVSNKEKELFDIIRQETPRNILLTFIYYVVCSQNDLSEILDKHPTTIEYHLKKLIDMEIIEQTKTRNGRTIINYPETNISKRVPKVNEKLYTLKDPVLIVRHLWNYKDSLENDKMFQVSFKIYIDANRASRKIKRKEIGDIKSHVDRGINSAIEIFYKIFPPPYCA